MELFEAHPGFQLFVDLDGVLVDFEKGIRDLGYDPKKKDFWKVLHRMECDEAEKWWASLEWAPGGQELWNFIKKYRPIILSSPDERPKYRQACENGKVIWVNKHLKPKPGGIIITSDKWKHATKFGILIDDYKKKLIPWEEHGGAGIHYQIGNPTAAIKELIDRFGFPRK